jgi:hypothetical protein
MTQTEALLYECLDEVEDVLRSYQHRRFKQSNAWASTVSRAFEMNGRVVTMNLAIDVTAPAANAETPDASHDIA